MCQYIYKYIDWGILCIERVPHMNPEVGLNFIITVSLCSELQYQPQLNVPMSLRLMVINTQNGKHMNYSRTQHHVPS